MLGEGITPLSSSSHSTALRGAATGKLTRRVQSSPPVAPSCRAQSASVGTQLLRSLHLLSVHTMQLSSARTSGNKACAFAWKGIDRRGNRQQGIAWQGLDESGKIQLSSVHTSGLMITKRNRQQEWISQQQKEVSRSPSVLASNDCAGSSQRNEVMLCSRRSGSRQRSYRTAGSAKLRYGRETEAGYETSSSSVEKGNCSEEGSIRMGSVQERSHLFDSPSVICAHCINLNYEGKEIVRSRPTCKSAATPPSTHQNVELFTSRSSDAVHTTKLYPGDDLQVIGGEGRRSGGDAGSRSPSTRSYDRNCNGKGNQLHETLSSQNALLSPTTTNNQFKPIGARNELLNSQLHANNHFHAALNSEYGCGVEGLVATGNNAMTMQRNGRCLYVNGLSSPLTQNAPVSMRRTNKPSMGTSSSVKQVAKEVEPKYADPFQGAPHDFQQRIAELASLEAETIRTERYRKAKRKTRTDKDS